jgi:putative salt-induced outer membrane protein YdiY
MKKAFAVVALVCMLFACAHADQIGLKNGDRLSGTIIKADADSLSLKSEFAGEVKIQWAAIEQITSSQPLYLTLKDGQVIAGTVSTTDGRIIVETRDAGRVTTAKESIQFIRSESEQAAYLSEIERLRNPKLGDLWSGSVDAGFSTSRGNAETTTMAIGMQAARTTPRDKISVYLASLFARNSTTGEAITTAKAIRGGTRYDFNLNNDLFAFALTDLEYDKFQDLDLRLVLGGGLGFHVKKSERTKLDLFAGGSFNQENFSTAPTRRSGEVILGEDLSYRLSGSTTLSERLMFFPNMSEAGEFRMTFDTTAVTTLSRWLSWQLTVSDRYVSNPIPGIKKNDLLLSTGIRVNFGRRN